MKEALQVIDDLMAPRDIVLGRSTATGILSLDLSLGGSLPEGSVEIYGEASTGKTSLLCCILAQAQRDGFQVALCPSEYLDLCHMEDLGVDLDALVLLTASGAEPAFSAGLDLIKEPRTVLAFDSATAWRPTHDEPGRWLATVSRFLDDVTGSLGRESCMVMVNQVRVPRSVDPDRFFAGSTDSSARKIANRFAARMELFRTAVSDDRYTMEVNIVSNSLACPCTISELPFVKSTGVDRGLDLVRSALKPNGPWYNFDGTVIQGELAAAAFLEKNPEVFENLRLSIMSRHGY